MLCFLAKQIVYFEGFNIQKGEKKGYKGIKEIKSLYAVEFVRHPFLMHEPKATVILYQC